MRIAYFVVLVCLVGISLQITLENTGHTIKANDDFTLVILPASDYPEAVCNDGTQAGYYISLRPCKFGWIFFLQGGWWCYDIPTCAARWQDSPSLMSNKYWSPNMSVNVGLLSANVTSNPDFYNWSTVIINYCSSDQYSGNRAASNETGNWHFRGLKILEAIVDHINQSIPVFRRVSEILYAGCSAGGQGVIVTADYFSNLFGNEVFVSAVADAGWLMDIKPIINVDPIITQLIDGYTFWNGSVNSNCALGNPQYEYMCYISPIAAPYISTRFYIHTEQYDPWQTEYSCCSPPYNDTENVWIQTLREAFNASIRTIRPPSAVFSGACFHHCFTQEYAYNQVIIYGQTLQQHLGRWYFSTLKPVNNLIDDCPGFNCSQGCPATPW